MTVKDKEKGTSEDIKYTVSDECNRPSTTLESLQGLQPVRGEDDPHATVTAGNASQLSDGAAACVVMDGDLASKRRGTLGHLQGLRRGRLRAGRDGYRARPRRAQATESFRFVCR